MTREILNKPVSQSCAVAESDNQTCIVHTNGWLQQKLQKISDSHTTALWPVEKSSTLSVKFGCPVARQKCSFVPTVDDCEMAYLSKIQSWKDGSTLHFQTKEGDLHTKFKRNAHMSWGISPCTCFKTLGPGVSGLCFSYEPSAAVAVAEPVDWLPPDCSRTQTFSLKAWFSFLNFSTSSVRCCVATADGFIEKWTTLVFIGL